MLANFGRFTFPAVVALVVWAIAATASAQSAKLTLLHVNDVYEVSAKDGKGGLAELMTLLRQEHARTQNHLVTLGGDLISPSVMSGLTKGKQMIELMNALGLDVAGFGNHEFDFGSDVLKERIAASKFTWLATNTLGADGGERRRRTADSVRACRARRRHRAAIGGEQQVAARARSIVAYLLQ